MLGFPKSSVASLQKKNSQSPLTKPSNSSYDPMTAIEPLTSLGRRGKKLVGFFVDFSALGGRPNPAILQQST